MEEAQFIALATVALCQWREGTRECTQSHIFGLTRPKSFRDGCHNQLTHGQYKSDLYIYEQLKIVTYNPFNF